ncbi:hypothetical protein PsorP6_006895 [Peronosclerospora sorghi]|uniref:Uncharacterized protein n=1 Tax=Peronosclerospora sorghi TaxID=230839 RepID=A0ACC0WB51_9STRA|nr:hypothetical protein PsorP6_006895 [Peronosclerospora sorghi]
MLILPGRLSKGKHSKTFSHRNKKIKNLAKHVASSPQRRKELSCAVTLQQPDSTVNSILSDVTTRWNSTYLMFRRALQLK